MPESDDRLRAGFTIGESGPETKLPESPAQVKIRELMIESLRLLRTDYWSLRLGFVFAIFYLALGAVLGVLAVTLVGWMVQQFNGPSWIIYTIASIPLAGTLVLILRWKYELYSRIYYEVIGKAPHVRFSRFDAAMGLAWPGYALILGSVIGIQAQLLHSTTDHWGLTISGDWLQCVTISLDNVCHGDSLEACSLQELRFSRPITHSKTSATLFFLFRFACDALVIILCCALWSRRKVAHLAVTIDRYLVEPNSKNLIAYLRHVCYKSKSWAKAYHDEFLFFCLVEKYLSRRYQECRLLMGLFPEANIPQEVLKWFVDAKGRPLTPIPNE